MSKQTAAARAVDAGTVAVQAVKEHGLDSPQAADALQIAVAVTKAATAQGCTKADFDAEHARR
jgi:hypothetical protein